MKIPQLMRRKVLSHQLTTNIKALTRIKQSPRAKTELVLKDKPDFKFDFSKGKSFQMKPVQVLNQVDEERKEYEIEKVIPSIRKTPKGSIALKSDNVTSQEIIQEETSNSDSDSSSDVSLSGIQIEQCLIPQERSRSSQVQKTQKKEEELLKMFEVKKLSLKQSKRSIISNQRLDQRINNKPKVKTIRAQNVVNKQLHLSFKDMLQNLKNPNPILKRLESNSSINSFKFGSFNSSIRSSNANKRQQPCISPYITRGSHFPPQIQQEVNRIEIQNKWLKQKMNKITEVNMDILNNRIKIEDNLDIIPNLEQICQLFESRVQEASLMENSSKSSLVDDKNTYLLKQIQQEISIYNQSSSDYKQLQHESDLIFQSLTQGNQNKSQSKDSCGPILEDEDNSHTYLKEKFLKLNVQYLKLQKEKQDISLVLSSFNPESPNRKASGSSPKWQMSPIGPTTKNMQTQRQPINYSTKKIIAVDSVHNVSPSLINKKLKNKRDQRLKQIKKPLLISHYNPLRPTPKPLQKLGDTTFPSQETENEDSEQENLSFLTNMDKGLFPEEKLFNQLPTVHKEFKGKKISKKYEITKLENMDPTISKQQITNFKRACLVGTPLVIYTDEFLCIRISSNIFIDEEVSSFLTFDLSYENIQKPDPRIGRLGCQKNPIKHLQLIEKPKKQCNDDCSNCCIWQNPSDFDQFIDNHSQQMIVSYNDYPYMCQTYKLSYRIRNKNRPVQKSGYFSIPMSINKFFLFEDTNSPDMVEKFKEDWEQWEHTIIKSEYISINRKLVTNIYDIQDKFFDKKTGFLGTSSQALTEVRMVQFGIYFKLEKTDNFMLKFHINKLNILVLQIALINYKPEDDKLMEFCLSTLQYLFKS